MVITKLIVQKTLGWALSITINLILGGLMAAVRRAIQNRKFLHHTQYILKDKFYNVK